MLTSRRQKSLWTRGSLTALLLLACGCDLSSHRTISEASLQGSRSVSGIPQDGLLAYYSFDGSLSNQTSALNDGVGVGVEFTSDRFGRPGQALRFNGNNAFVEIQESYTLQIEPPLSISFWVNADQVSSTFGVISTNYDENANAGVFAAFDSRGGSPSISVGDGGPKGSGSRRTQHSAQPLQAGEWYHIVGIVETANEMTVYVDGVQVNAHTSGSARDLAYTQGPAVLGRRVASAGAPPIYFSGSLDDVAFYSVALSQADVLRLFGTPPTPDRRSR